MGESLLWLLPSALLGLPKDLGEPWESREEFWDVSTQSKEPVYPSWGQGGVCVLLSTIRVTVVTLLSTPLLGVGFTGNIKETQFCFLLEATPKMFAFRRIYFSLNMRGKSLPPIRESEKRVQWIEAEMVCAEHFSLQSSGRQALDVCPCDSTKAASDKYVYMPLAGFYHKLCCFSSPFCCSKHCPRHHHPLFSSQVQ